MAVTTTKTNKPLNPRGNDQSPKGYNRAELYSGKALDFDGVNDEISVGAEGGTYNDFTLVWNLKTSYTGNYQSVFSDGSLFDFYIKADGQFRAYIGTANDTTSLPAINSGEWVNLVLTRSGSTGYFYYNGVLAETLTLPTSAMNNIDISIGQNKSSAYPLDGKIAGFKLFNTALTAAQVADLYNNPEKIVPTGVADSALKLWLPMQEGAGTTVYDGSGNGNHGTISGATWTHGVGAPVSQTAVIDWNKGTNLIKRSEDFGNAFWVVQSTRISVSTDQTTAPDGQNTADKLIESTNDGDHLLHSSAASQTAGNYTVSVYLKDNDRGFAFVQIATDNAGKRYTVVVDLSDGSVTDTESVGSPTGTDYDVTDAGNGWYRVAVTASHASSNLYHIIGLSDSGTPTYDSQAEPTYDGDGTSSIFAWGAQLEKASSGGPYVRTGATAQTSDVLLPQGLTAGRDITGVNLFENVRKQGALNLDGNSWAEVHDNASLDMTTTATLEAWVNCDNLVAAYQIIMVKSSDTYWTGNYGRYVLRANQNNVNWWFDDFTANTKYYTISLSGYNHLVVTKDGTEEKLYINGALASTQTGAATFTASPYSLVIGAQSSYAENWDNQLAQPRIYNRALTAEEIERNYTAGKYTYTND